MLSEINGQFIDVSRLNLAKYAQGPTAKHLFEYLYYHENDIQHVGILMIQLWTKLSVEYLFYLSGIAVGN